MKPPRGQRPASVVAASALGAFGFDWRGLVARLVRREVPAPGTELALEPLESREAVRARKLMSRSARLAALAMHAALVDAGWGEHREEVGAYLGVGASGGVMEELESMLRASSDAGHFTTARFGEAGLQACNPLLAFQLMNNFTLSHGAILEGVGGPNAALFSRGSGTVAALVEALCALAEGDCERALVGGADTALHPVTRAELARDGLLEAGLQPAEGAAMLALSAKGPGLARVEAAAYGPWKASLRLELEEAGLGERPYVVVLSAWGGAPGERLRREAEEWVGRSSVIDVAPLGESLAASAALAWVVGVDALQSGHEKSALVLTAGIDGDLGAVLLTRERSWAR
jgi:hypothetical protein